MRVVVTGANGFIGLHTVDALLKRGYQVVAIDLGDDRLRRRFFNKRKITTVLEDITSQDLENWMMEGDKVLHLAAIAKFSEAKQRPVVTVETNVLGTFNVIQCCLKRGVERLVFSSTGSVYSQSVQIPIKEDSPREPVSVYGFSKKQAEDWIFFFASQLKYIVLRYGYVYGEGKNWGAVGTFLKQIKQGKRPTIFGGDQTNDFTYVKDIVEANILALETKNTNNVFNIGTGEPVNIKDVCKTCLEALGSDLEPAILPLRSFDYMRFVYDISKAMTLLGYNPRWNLRTGVADMVRELSAERQYLSQQSKNLR